MQITINKKIKDLSSRLLRLFADSLLIIVNYFYCLPRFVYLCGSSAWIICRVMLSTFSPTNELFHWHELIELSSGNIILYKVAVVWPRPTHITVNGNKCSFSRDFQGYWLWCPLSHSSVMHCWRWKNFCLWYQLCTWRIQQCRKSRQLLWSSRAQGLLFIYLERFS